ncbi:hypothetical protein E2C01_039389 [Portunus trituberculatus]|uniref:Uncharacterized protein n=1 Tax=Portunus trituberculatus TaxID=210409 RepID=A0A5B7FGQ6_PORTR|nr:hypothetical protein [Portunus trituberculatus]
MIEAPHRPGEEPRVTNNGFLKLLLQLPAWLSRGCLNWRMAFWRYRHLFMVMRISWIRSCWGWMSSPGGKASSQGVQCHTDQWKGYPSHLTNPTGTTK